MEPVILKKTSLFRYDLPLIQNITVGQKNIETRSGFIIKLEDNKGNTGYGDIAPLPGLHRETLNNCLQTLKNHLPDIIAAPVNENILTENNHSHTLPPSAVFGLDMAKLYLLAEANNRPLHKTLDSGACNTIPVNALLMRENLSANEQIKYLINQGYSTLKVKTGSLPIDQEINRIQQIQHKFGQVITLRLDANRAWAIDDALLFLQSISPKNIEYIEEPLADASLLPELAKQISIPLALDESLNLFFNPDTPLPDWVGALILKPSVIGPIASTISIAQKAAQQNIKSVITSTFDSGLALLFYAHIAAALSGPETAAGLDTWRWLAHDIITPPFQTKHGCIQITDFTPTINHNMLTRIEI